jgi:hypothetical protein
MMRNLAVPSTATAVHTTTIAGVDDPIILGTNRFSVG